MNAAGREEASPLDRVLDVAVFGPIGLALEARERLPRWVEVGRRQVASQLTMARAVGRLAVDQGSRQAGPTVARLLSSAEDLLAELGIRVRDQPQGAPGAEPEGEGGPEPSSAPEPDAPGWSGAATEPPAAAPRDPAELAIPGYDTLSASQVVQRLPGLSPAELEAVREYELAGRNRKTILLKVAQLRAAS